jgi:hypothetical protein
MRAGRDCLVADVAGRRFAAFDQMSPAWSANAPGPLLLRTILKSEQ